MDCETCNHYDFVAEKCWFDPANPKKVTQPDAYCDYHTEKE